MSSKYSLPFDYRRSFVSQNDNFKQIEKKTNLEKSHSLIFMVRFFILHKWMFICILFIQVLITLSVVYFSPKVYKASCTILPNVGTEDLMEFGINYKSITSNRLIAFSKSDIVFGQSIEMIKKHDHLNEEEAAELYNENVSFSLGNEGEISIEFQHRSQIFSKELVQNIIVNCLKVNRLILKQNLTPVLFSTKNKLNDLDLEMKSLGEPSTKFEIAYKLNLLNKSIFLRRKKEVIENLINSKMYDNYFSLNKLESFEKDQFKFPELIFTNFLIFVLVFYTCVLIFATKARIQGFFKLALRPNN